MTTDDALRAIATSTERAGMTVGHDDICGRTALVARSSKFRWRWMATRLHTFLIAAAFGAGEATPEHMDDFLEAARDYAKATKGGTPLGQTRTAAVAVVVTDGTRAERDEWALQTHGTEINALAYPVLVDIARGTVSHPKRLILGGAYSSHLRNVVQAHVYPVVSKNP